MTGNARRSGPPWSVDLLADLHAGALDSGTEAELRSRVEADPEAQEILAALDATLSDLRGLRDLPPIPVPRAVADRIDAALAAEVRSAVRSDEVRSATPVAGRVDAALAGGSRPAAPVVDLATRRNRKRLGWGAGLLVAAAVAVGVVVVTLPQDSGSTGGVAQPATSASSASAPDSAGKPLAVKGNDFGAVVGDVLKAQNYGPLENQETLAGCLRGANVPSSKPMGVSPITVDGRPAVMALLPGGKPGDPGAIRIVVLDPATCGPDNPEGVLSTSVIGSK